MMMTAAEKNGYTDSESSSDMKIGKGKVEFERVIIYNVETTNINPTRGHRIYSDSGASSHVFQSDYEFFFGVYQEG